MTCERRSTLALLVALATGAAARPATVELLPVPRPALDAVDEAVRAQIEESAQTAEELAADPAADAERLALAFGHLGEVYLAYDLHDAAGFALSNAARLAPVEQRWQYLLGTACQETRQLDEAASSLGRALALKPGDVPTNLRLGQVELLQQRLDAAQARFEKALALDPRSAVARYGLGQIARQRGDPRAAIEHFREALRLQPNAASLNYPLALAYRDAGDREAAQRHLERRGDGGLTFSDPILEGVQRLATGAGVYFFRATRAFTRGEFGIAVQAYRRAVEADPENLAARQALASALVKTGDVPGALKEYDEVLRRAPDDPVAHYNLATILAYRGRLEEGVEHFVRAVDLAPDFVDARINLATALQRLGRPAEASRHLQRALELAPEDSTARLQWAGLLADMDRLDEALEQLEGVLFVDPRSAVARGRLGEVLFRLGRRQEGIDALRQALDLAVEPAVTTGLRLRLAVLLGRERRFQEAASEYDAALALDPDLLEAHFGRATALILAERYELARERLEASLARLADNTGLVHALARLLAACPDAAVRDGERALVLAQRAFEAERSFEHAATVAMALAEAGRFPEAIQLQQRLLEEVGRSGPADLLAALREDLERYRRGQPARAPWFRGTAR